MVDGLKRSDVVGTSICHGSADDMVLNSAINVLSAITRGGLNLRGTRPECFQALFVCMKSIVVIM